MIDFLLSISTLSGILISMVLSTVAGLIVYGISYGLICRHRSDELKRPTESLFGVVGVLVSLMLSSGSTFARRRESQLHGDQTRPFQLQWTPLADRGRRPQGSSLPTNVKGVPSLLRYSSRRIGAVRFALSSIFTGLVVWKQ